MFGYNNAIVQNDLRELSCLELPWEKMKDKTVLVTGANGMLATYLIYCLYYVSCQKQLNIKIVALSRTMAKMQQLFGEIALTGNVVLLAQDVCEPLQYDGRIDYIFHLAGNASPFFIKSDPIGIVKSNLLGTLNILERAKSDDAEKLVFASTREVYGATQYDVLREDSFGATDTMDNRSCYPESKRAAETMLRSYYLQHGVHGVSARIAHSYGPGMKIDNDGRVMADFIHNAVNHQNITLLSDGSAVRAFCYITDAIQGLLLLAFHGEDGEAYNLANETEPMPIREVAQLIASLFPERGIEVSYKQSTNQSGYCNYKRVALSTVKIEAFGFTPKVSLKEGLKRTILSFE